MKKFAATLLMTGVLAIGGFVTPANAAPKHDTTSSTSSTSSTSTTVTTVTTGTVVNYAQTGWWPN
ncbi:hypothetical protein BMF89_14010 [Arthrobacter sp. SRS-W-1-2016]|uniref:hypothetical protein n=1 Tax=Arthrobacter sp. SRS-W-1-2016 TaxID=1930254 RepID=UPI0009911366|nr:hypothetical protein [Arthrobacter sp. SRS-W-1-2016]OOP61112.1 hypothetical protein BMF89_14010 [Arthrobacter sp. SRS-W-1-2016]